MATNAELQQALRDATGYSKAFGGGEYGRFIRGAPGEVQRASDLVHSNYGTGYELSQQQGFTEYNPTSASTNPQFTYEQAQGLMSPVQTSIGTATQGRPSTLFGGQAGLATGQEGLMTGQEGIMSGQAGLTAGQAGLASGQEGIMSGQAGLASGQAGLATGQAGLAANQGVLQTGQQGISSAIGAPVEGQPTNLFAGQQGLMTGQQGLGTQITGVGQDISGVRGDITALEQAAANYQREAERQRTLMQQAGVTGREQLSREVGEVGGQANQLLEQQARQAPLGGLMGGPLAPQFAPAAQAASQFAQTQGFGSFQQPRATPATPQTTGVTQPVTSPMGPASQDPRDAFVSFLDGISAPNTMNGTPV